MIERKKKILLVDDVVEFVDLMKIELEAWGYEIIPAYDGMEGLKRTKSDGPDLILLDIMMPKMNGFEMLRKLREFNETTPVVMVSGKGDAESIETATKLGAEGYLCKTDLHAKLKETLKKFLGNGHAAKGEQAKLIIQKKK